MNQLKSFIALVFITISMTACMGNLAAPQNSTESVVYAGSTLQAITDQAARNYQYMSESQAEDVHQMLVQARLIRKEAIEATRAGNDGEAQTKLETLTSMLSTIQSTLQEYTDGEQ